MSELCVGFEIEGRISYVIYSSEHLSNSCWAFIVGPFLMTQGSGVQDFGIARQSPGLFHPAIRACRSRDQ